MVLFIPGIYNKIIIKYSRVVLGRYIEDGLKLSIRGKIVGLLLQDLDSMVKKAMVIERKVDDARNIRDVGVKDKRKLSQPSSS